MTLSVISPDTQSPEQIPSISVFRRPGGEPRTGPHGASYRGLYAISSQAYGSNWRQPTPCAGWVQLNSFAYEAGCPELVESKCILGIGFCAHIDPAGGWSQT